MPKPKCTEKEFINIWNEHKSTKKVANFLNTSESSVRARRRKLEKKYDTRLLLVDVYGRKKFDESMLITDDRVEVKLKINNGVVLIAGDQHYWPGHVPVMHKAFCLLSKRFKPFAQIWNGDAFDGSSISRHPSIGWESKPTVKEELETVANRSDEILKSSPNSKRIWCAGNHDLRFETRLASVAPEYKGVFGIHLKDHLPMWTPAWFVTINEGLDSHTEIRHREYGGVHAGYNNTLKSGINIVTGHDHRAEVVCYDDRRGRRYGVRHGMTADSSRDGPFVNYLEGRKVNWQSSIAILTFKDGVLLQPELALRFNDNSFQFRGEIITV